MRGKTADYAAAAPDNCADGNTACGMLQIRSTAVSAASRLLATSELSDQLRLVAQLKGAFPRSIPRVFRVRLLPTARRARALPAAASRITSCGFALFARKAGRSLRIRLSSRLLDPPRPDRPPVVGALPLVAVTAMLRAVQAPRSCHRSASRHTPRSLDPGGHDRAKARTVGTANPWPCHRRFAVATRGPALAECPG